MALGMKSIFFAKMKAREVSFKKVCGNLMLLQQITAPETL